MLSTAFDFLNRFNAFPYIQQICGTWDCVHTPKQKNSRIAYMAVYKNILNTYSLKEVNVTYLNVINPFLYIDAL